MTQAESTKKLIAEIARLIPPYWPNDAATNEVIIDWEKGAVAYPATPDEMSVMECIIDGVEVKPGEEIAEGDYAALAEDIHDLLARTMESVANLYAPRRPAFDQDPTDLTIHLELLQEERLVGIQLVPGANKDRLEVHLPGEETLVLTLEEQPTVIVSEGVRAETPQQRALRQSIPVLESILGDLDEDPRDEISIVRSLTPEELASCLGPEDEADTFILYGAGMAARLSRTKLAAYE